MSTIVVAAVALALAVHVLVLHRSHVRMREERDTAREEWHELFDRNPHPMYIYDLADDRFLAVNTAAVQRYGYSREEFVRLGIADITAPDEEQRRPKAPSPAPEVGMASEGRHRTKDGTAFEAEVSFHGITYGGRPARLALVQDLTARRALEAQLRQAQKMEAVARLAGGVAHDFNNLLTVIMAHAELLRAQAPPGDARLRDLDVIADTSQRARSVIRQLLAFSRRQGTQSEPLAPDQVVRGAATMLRSLIGEDIELRLETGTGGAMVKADRGQLEQVILNLAINARDAMPVGGSLTITTSTVTLDAASAPLQGVPGAGEYVRLMVADTGTGMTDEVRARLFEPFFTTKAEGKGTGLGLATVYGIVRQSGGGITVSSQPGRGSVFSVHLPVVSGAQATAARRAEEPPPRGRETVVLAEDDATVRRVTQEILQRAGYTVLAAATGEEALALAAHTADLALVVSDVVMPGMDGPTLVSRLREGHPGLRALYISGYAGDEVSQRGVVGSGVPLIEKPFTAGDLARRVREVLDAPA